METRERRFVSLERVRAAVTNDGKMMIEGYPIVYEQVAELWGFREVISQGAARDAIAAGGEVVLWNHDDSQPMASREAGTLEVTEDSRGVRIRADVSRTKWGRDGYEAIRAGVVTKMSFAFTVDRDGEQWNGDLRRIVRFSAIHDYSPVTYPAYQGTEVSARALATRNRPAGGPAVGSAAPRRRRARLALETELAALGINVTRGTNRIVSRARLVTELVAAGFRVPRRWNRTNGR